MAHLFRKGHLLLSLGLLLGLQIRKEDCGICGSDEKWPLIGFQARPSVSQTNLEPCRRHVVQSYARRFQSLPVLGLCPGLSHILFLSESPEWNKAHHIPAEQMYLEVTWVKLLVPCWSGAQWGLTVPGERGSQVASGKCSYVNISGKLHKEISEERNLNFPKLQSFYIWEMNSASY